MNQQDNKVEVIRQGYQISHEMKTDILELYAKSLQQDHFAHKSDYIRHNLEEKYGRCFSIIIYNVGTFLSHSFLYADDYLLEAKSNEHHILAYLLPPSYQQPQLIQEPIRPIRRSISPTYVSRVTEPPIYSRVMEPQQPFYPYYHYPVYGSRYYDGYYRRGYGYW